MSSNAPTTPNPERARELYLSHLVDSITPEEYEELKQYFTNVDCQRMFAELRMIYKDKEFRRLLKTRTTSARWNEIATTIIGKIEDDEKRERQETRLFRWMSVALMAVMVLVYVLFRYRI